jgi:hypothetical protein
MVEENCLYLDDQVAQQEQQDMIAAHERGVSYEDYQRMKQEVFTNSIINSIKKKAEQTSESKNKTLEHLNRIKKELRKSYLEFKRDNPQYFNWDWRTEEQIREDQLMLEIWNSGD